MPVYEYKALTLRGKTTSGIIDAESPLIARQKIRALKVFPVSVREVHDAPAKKGARLFSVASRFQQVRSSEVSVMTRQLATLIGAGFPLVAAIDILIPQTRSKVFKRQLAKIKDTIVEGNSFSRALSLFPRTFSSLYINMVHAGETSGTLEIVLDRLADISEKHQAMKNRIRAAMAYPILMTFIGAVVLFLLLTFVVPSITSIFEDMNQTLPAPTLVLINTSEFLKSYWGLFLVLAILILVVLQSVKKTARGRFFFDKTVLRLPGFGLLATKIAVARFARTLGSLLENGVVMLTALEIVKNIVGNETIAQTIENAALAVGKGQALAASLAEDRIFPDLPIQMIQVGEQSGQLENMLKKIADVFEGEVESSVMSLTSLLEPLLILMMAVVVGFIVISICLPIFEMNQLVM